MSLSGGVGNPNTDTFSNTRSQLKYPEKGFIILCNTEPIPQISLVLAVSDLKCRTGFFCSFSSLQSTNDYTHHSR